MKTFSSHFRTAMLVLCAAGLLVSQAVALPVATTPDQSDPVLLAASDCYAIGQQVAEQVDLLPAHAAGGFGMQDLQRAVRQGCGFHTEWARSWRGREVRRRSSTGPG